jgi:hypothetical protein
MICRGARGVPGLVASRTRSQGFTQEGGTDAQSHLEGALLAASPETAASRWVQQEVNYCLRNRPTERIVIVLTDGEIARDRATGDFD